MIGSAPATFMMSSATHPQVSAHQQDEYTVAADPAMVCATRIEPGLADQRETGAFALDTGVHTRDLVCSCNPGACTCEVIPERKLISEHFGCSRTPRPRCCCPPDGERNRAMTGPVVPITGHMCPTLGQSLEGVAPSRVLAESFVPGHDARVPLNR